MSTFLCNPLDNRAPARAPQGADDGALWAPCGRLDLGECRAHLEQNRGGHCAGIFGTADKRCSETPMETTDEKTTMAPHAHLVR